MLRRGDLERLWLAASQHDLSVNLACAVGCCAALAAALLALLLVRQRPVYLVDFSVHRAPEEWRWTRGQLLDRHRAMTRSVVSAANGNGNGNDDGPAAPPTRAARKQPDNSTDRERMFTDDDLVFMGKVVGRSGLGDDTYLPPCMLTLHDPKPSMDDARAEFEAVVFDAVRDVLNKSGVHPRQVGVVITNCSLFNPTPSLSATIMNHFKMPSSTINYSLGGMGCSAGVVAVDLAKQMLQLQPNTYALVISTENITQNRYTGNERSMLMPNCIFRVGGAAVLLSNKKSDGWRAKYKLRHVVRTNLAASDEAFGCVYECEDGKGHRGVRLSKDLMAIAGEALKANITTLGPLVLPLSEQLIFAGNLLCRKVLRIKGVRPYVPDFSTAFEHVCIHTGGRGVIDAIEQQLKVEPSVAEPSRAGLYRYGNVSSSSIWYVLAFIETFKGVERGDRVWQLAFGSGFKCNSAVWVANRRIGARGDNHAAWRGFDVERMRVDLASMSGSGGAEGQQEQRSSASHRSHARRA
jgi:3-ketoacyl-CoA synthase